MWDGLFILVLLCIVMATASFFFGSLPLSLSLSAHHLRLITALGTGVLVGTSLIIIIPEGIETLYSAEGSTHRHDERAIARATTRIADPAVASAIWERDQFAQEKTYEGIVTISCDESVDGRDTRCRKKKQTILDEDETNPFGPDTPAEETSPTDPEEGHEISRNPHAWVGISLIAGFVLMYLIDTVPRHATASTRPQRFQVSLNNFSFNHRDHSSLPSDIPSTPDLSRQGSHGPHDSHFRPSSTTIGLVIHACADGIALGASSATTSRLSFIIFIALMIHKAPAAFGLTSVLLKQGLSKRAARAHLIVFSLAAPLGALMTWFAAHILGYSSSMLGHSGGAEFVTGVLLLFSGGTFLYVAMHTMQEAGEGHDHGEVRGNGYASVPMEMNVYGSQPIPRKAEAGGMTDVLIMVGGMLLPLLTQFGHVH